MKSIGKTSNEVKYRWKSKAYKNYNVSFRFDTDQDIIDYLEAAKKHTGVTQIFREAMCEYIQKQEAE